MTSQVPEDTPNDTGSDETPETDPTPESESPDAGSTQPSVPPARRPRTRWIAAVAFLVVAGLIAGIAWLLRPQPAASGVPSATPQQAVTGFLDALVAADADRALEYALNRPADTRLLTTEMLAASQRAAPLSVVTVPEVQGGDAVSVPAEVKFGDKAVTINVAASRTEAGWRIAQVTSTIDPGPLPSELGATLNGQPLPDPAHLEVFPGTYVFGEKLREVTFGDQRVTVSTLGEDVRAGLQPVLTEAGEKRANKTAAAALKRCLAKRDAAPKGCPNSVTISKGQTLDTKSIRWSLVGDPWKNATYTLDVADPTSARGATKLRFRFRCTLTQNGEKYQVDQLLPTVDVRYLVSVVDAKEPVVWQRIS
ncbi:MAG: hypothetical protein QM695_14005 [Micropruina sp.]